MGGIAVDTRGRSRLDGLWACGEAASTGLHGANRLASNSLLEAVVTGGDVAADLSGLTLEAPAPSARIVIPPADDPDGIAAIRAIMSDHVGVLRNATGLQAAVEGLRPLAQRRTGASGPALAALMIATAALRRTESRGGHSRTDYPAPDPAQARRVELTYPEVM
jgi:L-aspartate oxidase